MSKVYAETFLNKKVLLTGHTGFKGSYLALRLKQLGAIVCGISLPPLEEEFSLFNQVGLHKLLDESHFVDLRDFNESFKIIKNFQPEMVFHLAALALVRPSYIQPLETFDTNIRGTLHILECARVIPSIQTIMNVTTDKVYENKEWVWGHREIDRLGGYDPYSNSKACSELVTKCYYDSFFKSQGLGIVTARAGNVYGGGDFSVDRIIPDCVRAFEKKSKMIIRNPHAIRPWQHVYDVIQGYLKLAQSLINEPDKFSGAWNFAPDEDPVTVIEVVKKIFSYLDYTQENIEIETLKDHMHETQILQLDHSKTKKYLQHKQMWNIEEGLKESAYFYKNYLNKDIPKYEKEKQLQQLILKGFQNDSKRRDIRESSTILSN